MRLDADVLRGSIVPLVTPFDEDGGLDLDAFERAVERQVSEGSAGVVVTGTSGEPTSLSTGERVQLYQRAVDVASGRISVVAATGSPHHAETVALTARAEEVGVDAALIVCPAFVRPSQRGLVEHFVAVAAATALPVLIYNIPGRAAVGVTAETVQRIAQRAPNLVGLKHASPDLDLVTELVLALGAQFRLFCGLESYSYPFLALGGAGLMSAVGNLLPNRVAELCDRVARDDHAGALRLHRELFALNRAIFFDTNPVPLKAMLAELGLGSSTVRLPLTALDDATTGRVLAALATVGAPA